jgi:hypothetical protein
MWVFDGEQWTYDGGEESNGKKPEPITSLRIDELVPELQVVEIVPVPKNTRIPPFPLP